jgi:hypothetical protein
VSTAAIVLRRTIRQFAAGPCFYCGRPTFRPFGYPSTRYHWSHTRDHVVPVCAVAKDKYGKSSPKRTQKIRRKGRRLLVVPACWQCNQVKGNTQPSQSLIARATEYVRSQSKYYARARDCALASLSVLAAALTLAT